jgi:two-component system chemotaxis sensor kinase CheA
VTITGHEEEFRRLFEQEAGTRLSRLAERAMELEAGGDEATLVVEMFRDAHTLKGGAAVVGFTEVAAVVHELEQLLAELRSGARHADAALVDGVLMAVDAVREMVGRAMAGAESGAAAATALAAIDAARGGPPTGAEEPSSPGAAGEPDHPVEAQPSDPTGQRPRFEAPSEDARKERPEASAAPRDSVEASPEASAAPRDPLETPPDQPAAASGPDPPPEEPTAGTEAEAGEAEAPLVPLGPTPPAAARPAGEAIPVPVARLDALVRLVGESLVALVRNAADHGVEPPAEREANGKPGEAVVRVQASQLGAEVVIAVSDDGRGIDLEGVRASAGQSLSDAGVLRAIFEPGLSTAGEVSGVSGRGVGLDAVRSTVDALRGRVEVRTSAGRGTEFRISVPMTLAVLRCVLVRVGGRAYALPMHSTALALPASPSAVVEVEGRPALMLDGEAIELDRLTDVLGGPPVGSDGRRGAPAAVVVATASGRRAFIVDDLLGQRDVVVGDLGRVLPRLPLVAGASIEPDGGIMLVLDPAGLVAAPRSAPGPARTEPARLNPARPPARLLVVDDAFTIRELQRSILERVGYEVATAADAEAALRMLAEQPADLVLTDVEMPGMDGFALTAAIRDIHPLASTPVLILTGRDDDADRRRGLEAGADGYLLKSDFDQAALLAAVRRLLGDERAP